MNKRLCFLLRVDLLLIHMPKKDLIFIAVYLARAYPLSFVHLNLDQALWNFLILEIIIAVL